MNMDYRWIILVFYSFKSGANEIKVHEACETETFNVTCRRDEVIIISRAQYGRMSLGRCVKLNYGHIGCSADVSHLASSRCSGRRICTIQVPDKSFARTKPCPDDLKPYLKIQYICQKVVIPKSENCKNHDERRLVSQNGYLASLISQESGCGSSLLPWHIVLDTGQRVKIQIYTDMYNFQNYKSDSQSCPTVAIIREKNSLRKHNLTLCDTVKREAGVYLSGTNDLEVGIVFHGTSGKNWLLHYSAVGCPNPNPLIHGSVRRNREKAVLKCDHTRQTWTLDCINNTWIGEIGNCSNTPMIIAPDSPNIIKPLAVGSSILIILAVALAIGLSVLMIGLCCLQKHRNKLCGLMNSDCGELSDGSEEKSEKEGGSINDIYWKKHQDQVQKVVLTTDGGLSQVRVNVTNDIYGFVPHQNACTPLLKGRENAIYGRSVHCTCAQLQTIKNKNQTLEHSCQNLCTPKGLSGRPCLILDPDVIADNCSRQVQLKTFGPHRQSVSSDTEVYPMFPLKSPTLIQQSANGGKITISSTVGLSHPHVGMKVFDDKNEDKENSENERRNLFSSSATDL